MAFQKLRSGKHLFLTPGVYQLAKMYQAHIIGDIFWVWRADHGSGVGWEKNRAANGIFVAGDDITIYALMVEHFQEYQTVWEGENGKIVSGVEAYKYENCKWGFRKRKEIRNDYI